MEIPGFSGIFGWEIRLENPLFYEKAGLQKTHDRPRLCDFLHGFCKLREGLNSGFYWCLKGAPHMMRIGRMWYSIVVFSTSEIRGVVHHMTYVCDVYVVCL